MQLKRLKLTPKDIDKQLRGLMSERHVAPDYLHLFQEVFEAQYQTETKIQAKDVYPFVTKKEVDRRVGQGLPVIDPDRLQFSEIDLNDLLRKICFVLTKQAEDGDSGLERLRDAAESGELSLSELSRKAVAYDAEYFEQLSEELGEDKEVIIFTATVLVASFLHVCVIPLRRKVDLGLVFSERCPICGGAPFMARIRREDGKRILECSLCNTQWTFNRLRCLSCGNEDQDTLGFFFVDKESAYRVDKCDKCKGYIKTVDERKRAGDRLRALVVEDVATLYLDMVADKEGYQSIRKLLWKEDNGEWLSTR